MVEVVSRVWGSIGGICIEKGVVCGDGGGIETGTEVELNGPVEKYKRSEKNVQHRVETGNIGRRSL